MTVLPTEVVDEYFETAKSQGGTSGMTLKTMCEFVRKEARQVVRAGEPKSDVADAFQKVAQDCYDTAQQEKWTNDYALDISDAVRRAVMSVR